MTKKLQGTTYSNAASRSTQNFSRLPTIQMLLKVIIELLYFKVTEAPLELREHQSSAENFNKKGNFYDLSIFLPLIRHSKTFFPYEVILVKRKYDLGESWEALITPFLLQILCKSRRKMSPEFIY